MFIFAKVDHSKFTEMHGDASDNKKSQVCKTPIVKIDRNKYLTLNRCSLGNYEKKEQNKSDQTAL
jgi:hypothetical protein